MTENTEAAGHELVELPGRATLFGFDPRPVTLRVRLRPRRWRMVGAGRIAGITLLVAPAVAIVPPHAPWALGALGVGGFLARRRWNERLTVEGVDGLCPSCEAPLQIRPGHLKVPHPVPCEGCHHDVAVVPDPEVLEAHRAAVA